MTRHEPLPTENIRVKCACSDCLVDTAEGMCQRCRQYGCSAQGDRECRAPNAYALSARRNGERKA